MAWRWIFATRATPTLERSSAIAITSRAWSACSRRGAAQDPPLPAARRARAVRGRAGRHLRRSPYGRVRTADGLPGRARPTLLRPRARPAAQGGSPGAAARAGDGGDLPHAARRDSPRRVPRARAPRRADAAAQALDRLADVDRRVAVGEIGSAT